MIDIRATLEGISTRLGDGVHAATDEVGLTHVERSHHNLQLLDGIERDGVAAAGELVAQTEVVVEVGTVDGEVGRTTVHTGKVHAVTAVGRETCHIGDAAGHRRQIDNLLIGDVGRRTGFLGGKLRGLGSHHNLAQLLRVLGERSIEVVGLGQLQGHVFDHLRLVANV